MFKDKFQNNIDNCNPSCEDDKCNVNTFQEIDVCVPITIEPYVNLGDAIVECTDDPYITPFPCNTWNKNGTCKFTITQRLCVMIPVEFRAAVSSGPTSVICGNISDKDCPSNDCDNSVGNEQVPTPLYNFYIKGKLIK